MTAMNDVFGQSILELGEWIDVIDSLTTLGIDVGPTFDDVDLHSSDRNYDRLMEITHRCRVARQGHVEMN